MPFEISRLAAMVADEFDTTVPDLKGKSRYREHVHARAILIRVCLDRKWSHAKIGKFLDRDHSTIANSRKQFPIYYGHYPRVAKAYNRLNEMREAACES